MFGSSTLDVAIGLIFVYLILGLLATAATEMLAAMTKPRAKYLLAGLRNLLTGSTKLPGGKSKTGPAEAREHEWVTRLLEHPLIRAYYRDGDMPSYLPSQSFAIALIDIMRERAGVPDTPAPPPQPNMDNLRSLFQAEPDPHVRRAALALLAEAQSDDRDVSDLRKVEDQIELWFNHAMERVGGWYKRSTQFTVLLVLAAFTVVLNVDSISIARTLARDSTLRSSVVAAAERYVQQAGAGSGGIPGTPTPPTGAAAAGPGPEPEPDRVGLRQPGSQPERPASPPVPAPAGRATTAPTTQPCADFAECLAKVDRGVGSLSNLGLPLGWASRPSGGTPGASPAATDPNDPRLVPAGFGEWVVKVFGLLLTIGAASLGAPFWFDVLNRFVNVRSAGGSPTEHQVPPKQVPKPREPEQTPAADSGRGRRPPGGAAGGAAAARPSP